MTRTTEIGRDVPDALFPENPLVRGRETAAAVLLGIGQSGPAGVEHLALQYAARGDDCPGWHVFGPDGTSNDSFAPLEVGLDPRACLAAEGVEVFLRVGHHVVHLDV